MTVCIDHSKHLLDENKMETCTSSDLLYNIHPQRKHQMFSEIISKKSIGGFTKNKLQGFKNRLSENTFNAYIKTC